MSNFKAKEGDKIKLLAHINNYGCIDKDHPKEGYFLKGNILIAMVDGFSDYIRASVKGKEDYIYGAYTLLNEEEYELIPSIQFEIGKWYKFKSGTLQIGKCIEITEKGFENIKFDPWIVNSNCLHDSCGNFSPRNIQLIRELKEEDECIQKFLPKKEQEYKIGDEVYINDRELPIEHNWMGEGNKFTHQGPYIVEAIKNECITKLSGITCSLSFGRFIKIPPEKLKIIDDIPVKKQEEIISEQWKPQVGEWAVMVNGGSYHSHKTGAVFQIIEIEGDKLKSKAVLDHSKQGFIRAKDIRKALPSEIPQIKEEVSAFNVDKIQKQLENVEKFSYFSLDNTKIWIGDSEELEKEVLAKYLEKEHTPYSGSFTTPAKFIWLKKSDTHDLHIRRGWDGDCSIEGYKKCPCKEIYPSDLGINALNFRINPYNYIIGIDPYHSSQGIYKEIQEREVISYYRQKEIKQNWRGIVGPKIVEDKSFFELKINKIPILFDATVKSTKAINSQLTIKQKSIKF